jgi:P27 family predicted phage terminase small subunit
MARAATPLKAISGSDGLPPEPNWDAIYDNDSDRTVARELWGATVRELSTENVLTVANGHAVKRLVQFAIQYERASRHVADNGAILPASQAKIGQFNPYWAVMKHASEEIRILEGELGIAPTKRSRAKPVKREKKVARPSDRFLTGT